jgi:hypothetical protein
MGFQIKGWQIVRTPPRKTEKFDKKIGVIQNGDDNAYPTRMEYALNNSITAKSCADTYKRFLIGKGFAEDLNKTIVGRDESKNRDITAFDLLVSIAHELSRQRGTWIKTGYNGKLETNSLYMTPSKYCRFGKEDDNDFKGKILVYDNWDIFLNPKGEKFDKTKIETYNVYDSKEENIKYQITGKTNPTELELLDALKKWKGQIYTRFLDNEFTYPLSPVDPVQHDADTEFQISLFKNGELRRGFFAKYILAHEEFENKQDYNNFITDLQSFEGASEGGSIMTVEVESLTTDDKMTPVLPFAIQEIKQNINDSLFKEYESSIANNIRKAFNNIPPVLIDYQEGKLGNTSGESIVQAATYYNTQTEMDRMEISNIFKELMKNWHIPELRNKDWTIKKLEYGAIDNI